MTEANDDLIELYRANGLPEAHGIRLLLEEQEISVWIDNELLQGVVGELPMGWNTAPRLMVRREDEERAQAILDHFFDNRSDQAEETTQGLCLACGQQMGDASVCPKCGWSYLMAEAAPE
jgi:hypothetical protein